MRWLSLILLCLLPFICSGENVDPYSTGGQFAWCENTGWFNFQPGSGDGVQVESDKLTGFVWAENIGWINLSPTTYGGVYNDGNDNLSGYGWGENVGWINFNPVVAGDSTDYGVKIDYDGGFYGWAWGENIGWINFGIADNYVVACKVTIDDLVNFSLSWLQIEPNAADLDGDLNRTDLDDYCVFADYWQDFCPDGWLLKQ
ncbi:MAG: hypothetical protein ACIAQZ_11615 [Sedimentisphaeraceae bacterium JB056]